jgi:YHS domain-containing protein
VAIIAFRSTNPHQSGETMGGNIVRFVVVTILWLNFTTGRFVGAQQPDSSKPDSTIADRKALAAFQGFIGDWKGVGQPRRGSSQGSWSEESQWAWRFAGGHAEIVAKLDHDPYFGALRLQAGERPGQFRLFATSKADQPNVKTAAADENSSATKEARYHGTLGDDGRLVLNIDGDPVPARPARVTLRLVAGGDRLVALYEARNDERFARLAEVGSTRKGSAFAVKRAGAHECIVTGGQGTIAVEYKGETYYVCCTGCRDLFKQDPEKILAEYRERKAKEALDAKR